MTDHGSTVEVTGESWMDHQWYNPTHNAGGWNWFSVQLDNFTQYMLAFIQDGNGKIVQVIATEVKDYQPFADRFRIRNRHRIVDEPCNG